MNNFQIVSNGQILDTYDDISVSFNYQIEDILDISKRNASFSKTITIPGTPFNNEFFKRLFDVNVDTITFNPKKAIPTIIRIGEEQIMSGVLQLLNVNINNNQVDYEVVIVGQLKNILNEFGELTLRNIDLSEYNHARSKVNITKSWDYSIFVNGTQVDNHSPGQGYVYPYIIYGNNQDIYHNLYASNMFPAVYLKTCLDKMFNLVGYTYTSDFFNSEYFSKLILPFVDDKLQMDEEEIINRRVIIGVDGILSGETTNPLIMDPVFEDYSITGYRVISPLIDDNCFGLGTPGTWYSNSYWFSNQSNWVPLERKSGLVGDLQLQDPNNEWSYSAQTYPYYTALGNYPDTYARYTCQKSGFYDVGFLGYMFAKYYYIGGGSPNIEVDSGELKYNVKLLLTRGSNTTTLDETGELAFTPSSVFITSPVIDTLKPLTLDVVADNIYIEVGDIISIEFGVTSVGVSWDGFDGDIAFQCVLPMTEGGVPTQFYVKPSNNTLQGKDDDVNMNQILPNVKMKDMFLSLIKMFNLVVMDNPEQINDLIIEPRDDFYQSRQKVVDWTYKLNQVEDIKITPMSELDSKEYYYTYKEDADYYNEKYTDETKKVYGEYLIDVDNDFSDKRNKLEILFSPTPNGQWGIYDRVAPYFANLENITLQPKKVKPRILFYGGKLKTSVPINFKDTADSLSITTLNAYPYCGMWDNPFTPTADLEFGLTDKIYWTPDYYPTNTLVEQFHKNTLLDIIDINSKLLEASFHLTPSDISQHDFRNIILIDNAYWRVNKIKDYNPIGTDKTTKVVLYKINNINIFTPDNVEIALSNKSCPEDVVGKMNRHGGKYYVSASGQIITADCCSSLGGNFINGTCWVIGLNSHDTSTENTLRSRVSVGNTITPDTQDRAQDLQEGTNSVNSPGVTTRGTNNYIGYGVKSGAVYGDNNSLVNNSRYTHIIGSGNTIGIDIKNALIVGNNNEIISTSIFNTGATPLNNVVILGNNVPLSAVSSNTLYTDNIVMSPGSTLSGFSQNLTQTLAVGNNTGAYDIVIDSNQRIENPSSLSPAESFISLGTAIRPNELKLSSYDSTSTGQSTITMDDVVGGGIITLATDLGTTGDAMGLTLDSTLGQIQFLGKNDSLGNNITQFISETAQIFSVNDSTTTNFTDVFSIDPNISGNGTGLKSTYNTTNDYMWQTANPVSFKIVLDNQVASVFTTTYEQKSTGFDMVSTDVGNNILQVINIDSSLTSFKNTDGNTGEFTEIEQTPLDITLTSDLGGVYSQILQKQDKISLFTSSPDINPIVVQQVKYYSNTTTTTNAVATTIITLPTLTGVIYNVNCKVTGLKTNLATGYVANLFAGFRNNAGTLSQIGTTDKIQKSDFTTATSSISVSGTNIIVQVTGEAATTINWTIQLEVL